MNSQLASLFESIELQRVDILKQVRRSPEKFNVKPRENKWSIGQILAHVVTAEKLTLQYMTKKIQGIDHAGTTGLIEEFKMIILKISQRIPLKFKAPQIVVNATPEYSNLDELEVDWLKTRNEFRHLIDRVPQHQLNKKIYKHIIVGRLNTIHAVKFLREHTIHHWPQIKRLLK